MRNWEFREGQWLAQSLTDSKGQNSDSLLGLCDLKACIVNITLHHWFYCLNITSYSHCLSEELSFWPQSLHYNSLSNLSPSPPLVLPLIMCLPCSNWSDRSKNGTHTHTHTLPSSVSPITFSPNYLTWHWCPQLLHGPHVLHFSHHPVFLTPLPRRHTLCFCTYSYFIVFLGCPSPLNRCLLILQDSI